MPPVIMHQSWRDLLFLHWDFAPETVQKTLPPGLKADAWNGRAWVGLVPFFMQRVRPRGLPALPLVSDFLELNVRTYVRDSRGRPGVWFYSLDCNQPIAVVLARAGFSLPYFHAAMSASRCGDHVDYLCRRRGRTGTCRLGYRPSTAPQPAAAGTLEEFLVERYRLFAPGRTGLLTGCVRHAPYQIAPARWSGNPTPPLAWAGFDIAGRPPAHAVVSRGVDVEIFPPERVD